MRKYFEDHRGHHVWLTDGSDPRVPELYSCAIGVGANSGPMSFQFFFSKKTAREMGEGLITAADEAEKGKP